MTIKKSVYKIGILAAVFAIIDQVGKALVLSFLQQPFYIFSWFKLEYHQNLGVAFGFAMPYLLIVAINFILLALIPFLAVKYLDLRYNYTLLCIALALGGAIGNIIDRVFRGHVVDFIAIGTFPVFNFADAFLCTGIFLIVAFYAKIKRI